MMRQHIGIRDIKKDLLYPVILVHRIEGHSYLIKLTGRQLTAQSVIYDFNVGLCQLCCFLTPDVCQLAALECDGLQLFTLLVIVHAPEDNLIAVGLTGELQRRHVDLPIPFCLIAKHPVYSAGQLCKGAVAVRYVGFADADKVSALIPHQPQDVVLRRVNALSAASAAFHHDIALCAAVNLAETWICLNLDVHSSSP